jgi:hypothetical protein
MQPSVSTLDVEKEIEESGMEPTLSVNKSCSPESQSNLHRQNLPAIIHLANYVGFTDKPIISQAIEDTLASDRPALSYLVLDFQHAISVESCMARFLAQQSNRLASQKLKVQLVVTGAKLGSDIEARLSQGGLRFCWPRNSLMPSNDEASDISLAFDTVYDFLQFCGLSSPDIAVVLINHVPRRPLPQLPVRDVCRKMLKDVRKLVSAAYRQEQKINMNEQR